MLLIFASAIYLLVVLVTELMVALRPDYFTKINKIHKVGQPSLAAQAQYTKAAWERRNERI